MMRFKASVRVAAIGLILLSAATLTEAQSSRQTNSASGASRRQPYPGPQGDSRSQPRDDRSNRGDSRGRSRDPQRVSPGNTQNDSPAQPGDSRSRPGDSKAKSDAGTSTTQPDSRNRAPETSSRPDRKSVV